MKNNFPNNRYFTHPFFENLLFIVFLLLGCGLRFYRLGFKSLWADEGVTWMLAKYGALSHGHPRLYFGIVGIFLKIFGESEVTLRLLSAISGTLILIIAYIITRNITDARTASCQTLILALSPVAIFSSQNARMYPICTVGMLLSLYIFIKALQNDSWFYWFLFSILNAINLMLDHTTGFPLIAYFIFIIIKRTDYPGCMRKFLWSGLLTTLFYSYEFPKTYLNLTFMSAGGYADKISSIFSIPVKCTQLSYYLSTGYLFYPINKGILKNPLSAVFIIITFIFIAFIFIIGFIKLCKLSNMGKCILLTGFIALFLQVLMSGYLPYKLFFPLTILTMVLAVGLNHFKGSKGKVFLLLYIVIVFINLIHYYSLDSLPSHPENWRKAANYLMENAGPEDLVYTTGNRNGLFTLRFYLKNFRVNTACRTFEADLLGDYDFERTKKIYDFSRVLKNGIEKHNKMWVLLEDWGSERYRGILEEMLRKNPSSKYIGSFGKGLKLFMFPKMIQSKV
jgi:4-amino-4-deoxy-L-arabinose transferase-like glycosyltransferase